MSVTVIPALTDTLTLDAFVARLASHPVVDGILFMGSTGAGAINAASDYDVFLILDDDPATPYMVVTWVDERFTEVYCSTVTALARIIAEPTAWYEGSEEGAVVNWLKSGRIAYDRAGRLTDAQRRAHAASPIPVGPPERPSRWWHLLSYNVAQAKRYLSSDDPGYREVVDFRLLYGLAEVMHAYFIVRELPWRGEKAAIQYWMAHDPDYLAGFRACLAETDRERKVAGYEELARLAVTPVGPLWTQGAAMVTAGASWGAGPDTAKATIDDVTALWRAIVGP